MNDDSALPMWTRGGASSRPYAVEIVSRPGVRAWGVVIVRVVTSDGDGKPLSVHRLRPGERLVVDIGPAGSLLVTRTSVKTLDPLSSLGHTPPNGGVGLSAQPIARGEQVTISAALSKYGDFRRAQDLDIKWTQKVLRIIRKGSFASGWTEVRQIEPDGIVEILNGMRENRQSPKYRNHTRGAWHSFCEFCVNRSWLTKNPIDAVPSIKCHATKPRYVPTWTEIMRLYYAVKDLPRKRDCGLIYLIAATTGIRNGEMRALEQRDLSFDGECYSIRVRAEVAKNGKERSCLIPDFLTPILAQRAPNPDPNAPLFLGVPKPDKFDIDLRRANIPKANDDGQTFSFHSFRYFFDQQIQERQLELREDLRGRAEAMGHLDERVTKSVYDTFSQDPMRETLRKIGPPSNPFAREKIPKSTPRTVDRRSPDRQDGDTVRLIGAPSGAPANEREVGSNPLTPIAGRVSPREPLLAPGRDQGVCVSVTSEIGSWAIVGPGFEAPHARAALAPCGRHASTTDSGIDRETISAIVEGVLCGLAASKAYHREDPYHQAPGRDA